MSLYVDRIQNSIRTNALYRFLNMIRKEEGHQDDKILIMIDEKTYQLDEIKEIDKSIIIEDLAYNELDREIMFYCLTNYNSELHDIEVNDDGEMTLRDFFAMMYWPMDAARNVVTTSVRIESKDKLYSVYYHHELCFLEADPSQTIKHMTVVPAPLPASCQFKIRIY